jgi:hypothetical protein
MQNALIESPITLLNLDVHLAKCVLLARRVRWHLAPALIVLPAWKTMEPLSLRLLEIRTLAMFACLAIRIAVIESDWIGLAGDNRGLPSEVIVE